MDRSRRTWMGQAIAVVVGGTLALPLIGCNMLPTAAWILRGIKEKAEYKGLEEKRVAVVCRPPASLQFRNATAARDLAKLVGQQLKEQGKKIDVIDQREIAEYVDENDWDEYTDIGKAVGADMVVAIDLLHFSLQEEQTLYQGRAQYSVAVYDMNDNGNITFEREVPQVLFPPNSPIPSADKPEAEFRRQFIMTLAERVSHYFVDHDPYTDFATDSNAL